MSLETAVANQMGLLHLELVKKSTQVEQLAGRVKELQDELAKVRAQMAQPAVLNPDKTLTADRDEARAALADMTHRYEAATEQLQSGQVP